MLDIDISKFIRTIPDYPVKGVNFYDLNSLFASNIWGHVLEDLADQCIDKFDYPTHIVGIESRGFVVGSALAHAMNLPFVMVRKKGAKYPGKLIEEVYDLEYGDDSIVLQQGLLGHTSRVIIADDLIATGGSAKAAQSLLERTGATALGFAVIIDLQLNVRIDMNLPMACSVCLD